MSEPEGPEACRDAERRRWKLPPDALELVKRVAMQIRDGAAHERDRRAARKLLADLERGNGDG